MKRTTFLLTLLVGLSLLLAGCKSSAPQEATTNPQMVIEAANQTADAMMRTMAASTPTPAPETPTPSALPSTPTSLPVTPLATSAGGTQPAAITGDKAEFVADITVPDGTVFKPGVPFVKTWRLKNSGTSTWTTTYTIVFASGDQIGAPASLVLPVSVPPGQTVDISVPLVAPTQDGTYTGNFLIANSNGQRFGIDPGASQPFYVVIVVGTEGTPAAAVTPSATGPVVTTTPGAGTSLVNWVFLSVDNANIAGCPHTFNFTAQVTLNAPAIVTYQLEVTSNTPGVNPPVIQPVTANMQAGTTIINFSLNFTSTFNGTVQLHITAPENVYSNPVTLNLICPYP